MRQTKIAAAVLAVLITAGSLAAQNLPPGKWWHSPEVAQKLEITQEQQDRLDATFRSSANELIDLKAEVEKRGIELRGELEKSELNRQALKSAAARLSEARGRLFERELMLLADMRGVLTQEQWTKFRNVLESRRPGQSQHPGQSRRPGRGDRRRPRN